MAYWICFGTRRENTGNGLMLARFDQISGQFSQLRHVEEIERPTWIKALPSRQILLATTSSPADAGSLVSLRLDAYSGVPEIIDRVPTGGTDPTYIGVNEKAGMIYAANFRDGIISVIPFSQEGELFPAVQVQKQAGTGPHPRQDAAHPHAAELSPGARYLISPDLGADKLFVYKVDASTGLLEPNQPAALCLPAGSGPRHLVFHPNGQRAYLILELTAELQTLHWNEDDGTFSEETRISLLSPGFDGSPSASELAMTRDGQHLYVTNRGENEVIVFEVEPSSGSLKEVQRIDSGGVLPWHFAISPDEAWLIVANFKSGNVSVLARDKRSGLLTPTDADVAIPQAAAVAFADFQ